MKVSLQKRRFHGTFHKRLEKLFLNNGFVIDRNSYVQNILSKKVPRSALLLPRLRSTKVDLLLLPIERRKLSKLLANRDQGRFNKFLS